VTDPHSEARQAGYDAYTRGLTRTANPYPYRTMTAECTAWARGFAAARTDLARQRRKATNGDTP
jgi:hypothetical protein